jgi:diamine N-acetyltransferase
VSFQGYTFQAGAKVARRLLTRRGKSSRIVAAQSNRPSDGVGDFMFAVRIARIDDAPAVADLAADVQRLHSEALPDILRASSSDELLPLEKVATLLQDPNSLLAVAEINGEVVGCIHGTISRRTETEFKKPDTYVYVQAISVREDVRRQGVGMALIAFIEDWAVTCGVIGLQVNYWEFNARAQRFFESCGFSPLQATLRRTVQRQES